MKIEHVEIHPREQIYEPGKKCYEDQKGTLVFRGDGKERSYSFQFKLGVRFVATRIVTASGEQKTGRIELYVPSLYAQVFGARLGLRGGGWILNEPGEGELKREFEKMGAAKIYREIDREYMCGTMNEAFQVLSKIVRGENILLANPTYFLGGARIRNSEFYKNFSTKIIEGIPRDLRKLIEQEHTVEVGDSWDGTGSDAPLVIYGDGLYGIEAKIFQPS